MKVFFLLLTLFFIVGCGSQATDEMKPIKNEKPYVEPSTFELEEAINKIPFEVDIPTYFPFEVVSSYAQFFEENTSEVVLFFPSKQSEEEIIISISKTKKYIEPQDRIEFIDLMNGRKGEYLIEYNGIIYIQTIFWEHNDLFYELQYRGKEEISMNELSKILESVESGSIKLN